MIYWAKDIQNIGVTTDEKLGLKSVLSEGCSRGHIER